MLEINNSFDFDLRTSNLVIPEVYIPLVVINDDYIDVYYSIGTHNDTWYLQEKLLETGVMHLHLNDQKYSESFTYYLERKAALKQIIFKHRFKSTSKPATITAYCSTGYVSSKATQENILNINGIVPDGYININNAFTRYEYISKIIDLRVMKAVFKNPLEKKAAQPIQDTKFQTSSKLFVSYDGQRKSNIAFIFDLEKFLRDNSTIYRFFSADLKFKEQIINSNLIDVANSSFYAKNISLNHKDYVKIPGNIIASKTRNDFQTNDYMISTNHVSNDDYEYEIKIDLKIKNPIKNFINISILSDLRLYLDTLEMFYREYVQVTNDREVNNDYEAKLNFYQNYFEKYINNFNNLIHFFSKMYKMFTGNNESIYYKLFTNMLHPLITNAEILAIFIENSKKLEKIIVDLLDQVNKDVDFASKTYTEEYFVFTKEFKQNESINYGYQHGYEVIKYENYQNKNENFSSLLTLNPGDKDFRKTLEFQKYFPEAEGRVYDLIDHYSMSILNFKNREINMLNQLEKNISSKHDILYLMILDYNLHNRNLDDLHTHYMQTCDNNVYIKTISAKSNESSNRLLKNIPFDKNEDSQEKSVQHMYASGLKQLFYISDPTNILPLPQTIIQNSTTITVNDVSGSFRNASVSEIMQTPNKFSGEYKAVLALVFNAFFKDTLIYKFDNFDLYSSEPTVVNPIFTKKLQQYNKYYIVRKKISTSLSAVNEIKPFITEFTTYNTPTQFLNRVIVNSPEDNPISLEDIL